MPDAAPLLWLAACLAAGGGAEASERWQRPTPTTTRYEEDWSGLATRERWTDAFKAQPIGDDLVLTTGLEWRGRTEHYQHNRWGDGASSDDRYAWWRALPFAELRATHARLFVQPMAAYAPEAVPSRSPIDGTGIDVLQAFGDIDVGAITLRLGRQMLSLGSERLIGTRYGPNVPLAFDGFRASFIQGEARVDLLAARPVQPRSGDFDDRRSRSKSLWGVYASRPAMDLYYLGYRNASAHFGDLRGRELRHSVGTRLHGTRGGLHWNLEALAQTGEFADRRIRAWTVGTETGHRSERLRFQPDFTVRFNVVSGDIGAGNRTLGTFNALFPKGRYFGELSPIGPANIVNVNPRLSAALRQGVSASFAAAAYWRYSADDGLYDIPGNLIRPPSGSRARFVGKQFEAELAWQATPELSLSTSLSSFDAGRFLQETGTSRTIVMLAFETSFRF